MDFDSIFGVTSTASKQFEARWFFDFPMESSGGSSSNSVACCDYDTTTNNNKNNNHVRNRDDDDFDYDPVDPPCKVRVHRMPFQRRTLSYWIGIQYGSRRSVGSKKHNRHGKQYQRHVTSTTTATTTRTKHQKLDLLNALWQHRVRNYNDAFLSSPRRNTRNYYAKVNTPPLPTPPLPLSTASSMKKTMRSPNRDMKKTMKPQQPKTPPTTSRASPGRETKNGLSSANKHYTDKNKTGSDCREELGPEQFNDAQNHVLVLPNLENTSVDNTPPRPAVLVSESGNSTTALENSDHHRHQHNSTPVTEFEDMNDLLEWKERLPSVAARQRESMDSKARVLFHFLFINDDQKPCFLTDATPENYDGHRRCIFCYFDGGSDAGLLMHCVTCHGQLLSFKAARSEDGTLHIAVTKKIPSTSSSGPSSTGRDFVYVRRSTPQLAGCVASVPFVKRSPSKACSLDLQTRRKMMRLLAEAGADEETRLQFVPGSDVPVRQYFHSRSNEPMLPGEWDVDSDDEDDEGWLTRTSEQLMDDFDDVTPQEKRFTKLWNRFMKSHEVIADHVIPSKCFEFIRTHANFLIEHDLRDELMLHCMGFWDSGLISSTHLMTLMAEFDKGRTAQYSESSVVRYR